MTAMTSRNPHPGRRRQPTWLLIAWLPLCVALILLNTAAMSRDGFGWLPTALVVAAATWLGVVLRDLATPARGHAAPVAAGLVYVPCVDFGQAGGEENLAPQGAFLPEEDAVQVLDFWASQGWSRDRLVMDHYPLFTDFEDWVEAQWDETGDGTSRHWTGTLPPRSKR